MAGLGRWCLVSSSTRAFDRYGTITRESREPAITHRTGHANNIHTHTHSVIYPPSPTFSSSSCIRATSTLYSTVLSLVHYFIRVVYCSCCAAPPNTHIHTLYTYNKRQGRRRRRRKKGMKSMAPNELR